MTPSLVLAVVNAPHTDKIDARTLARGLLDHAEARTMPGHMSAFFGEVSPALQIEFARQFDITEAQLITAARAFAAYSGETYPLAA